MRVSGNVTASWHRQLRNNGREIIGHSTNSKTLQCKLTKWPKIIRSQSSAFIGQTLNVVLAAEMKQEEIQIGDRIVYASKNYLVQDLEIKNGWTIMLLGN